MAFYLNGSIFQAFATSTNNFLSGGKVYTYVAGTSTLVDSFPTLDDAIANTNANTNPVILDSRGEAVIALNAPTKVVLKDANDNQIWSVDDVGGSSQTLTADSLQLLEQPANGSSYVEIKAPTALSSSTTYTLPSSYPGTDNGTLGSSTAGTLSWITQATQAEQETGTSTTTYVAPGRQKFHPSSAKGWCQGNTSGAIAASFNVTSITDNGTGDWTINFTLAMGGSFSYATGICHSAAAYHVVSNATTDSSHCRLLTFNTSAAAVDVAAGYFVVCFGDYA